jgi:hypothetical protein
LRGAAGTGQVQGMTGKRMEDCFGRSIRLTEERLAHILEHPEMRGMEPTMIQVLRQPQRVRRSKTDLDARLFYAFHPQTLVGGK